jgi:hypothetical protein
MLRGERPVSAPGHPARRHNSLICIGTRQMNARHVVAAEKTAILMREYRDGIS